MDDATAARLNALNVRFYRDHARAFSDHRADPWPGWRRLLRWLPTRPLSVLDVGCGNGRLGRFLAAEARVARYDGVDASRPLLDEVRERPPADATLELHERDFVAEPPETALPAGRFDLVALFGVLHGIPGTSRRRALVESAAQRVAPGGVLALASWRFAEHPDLERRALPRDTEGAPAVDAASWSANDFFMPFGPERALRYAHALSAEALDALAADLGLERVDAFEADGRDGALNRYRVLRRAEPA